MAVIRVLVEIEGGCLRSVRSDNEDVVVELVDYDNLDFFTSEGDEVGEEEQELLDNNVVVRTGPDEVEANTAKYPYEVW